MLQTSERLLRLLAVLSSRRSFTGSELAERLEITDRTLRRDVDRLRNLGYPVQSTSGVAGGYRLGAGADLPPLLLDDDEAVAVSIGLRTAAGGTVAEMDEASVRALGKLERVLPERLRKRVEALHAFIVPFANTGPTVDAETLSTIASACHDHERLCFTYRARDGAVAARVTEPCGMVCTGRRWYLVAWDLDRADFRTFRVDRMEAPIGVGPRFPPRDPPDRDLAAYVSRSVSTGPYAVVANVVLHASIEDVSQHISPGAGVLQPIDASRCRLTTGARTLETVAAWIGMLGVDFEVEDPPELTAYLRGLATRLSRAVDGGAPQG
jgi:predicted DNA-binding transcriptional regulator YafY